MVRPVSLETMQERCAKRLYESFPPTIAGGVPWKKLPHPQQEDFRRMVTEVFIELFKMDATDVALFFIDGRPL